MCANRTLSWIAASTKYTLKVESSNSDKTLIYWYVYCGALPSHPTDEIEQWYYIYNHPNLLFSIFKYYFHLSTIFILSIHHGAGANQNLKIWSDFNFAYYYFHFLALNNENQYDDLALSVLKADKSLISSLHIVNLWLHALDGLHLSYMKYYFYFKYYFHLSTIFICI